MFDGIAYKDLDTSKVYVLSYDADEYWRIDEAEFVVKNEEFQAPVALMPK